ncbi:MAG TPA: DNA polymerase III subunit [Pyrinomonadaceae bacterium]|jgi:DNA polymerase-3 subunit delta'|nr:DNA polymerase III subunit [Pyrinomonadaceae bacterium]
MFSRLVGNQRAQEALRRMLANGRVPGALLFAGADGVGKKLFALELAKALNCRSPVGVEACGHCPVCERIGKFAYPAADVRDAYEKVIWSDFGDVGLLLPRNRLIVVHAVRDLERESNFRPFEGRARVFIVEEADRLNEAASNALLKTLEEPHPASHLILVTSRPASLLPTIRSRCQTVRFAPVAAAEIEQYLVREHRRSGEEARLAALLSRGRIAHALELNLDKYRSERDSMLETLEALVAPADRMRLLRAAEDLSDAKRKDDFEPRLEMLETLIHDVWLLAQKAPAAALVNEDVRERLARLGERVESRRPARWLARIAELRAQLAVNINRRVAADALLLSMAE